MEITNPWWDRWNRSSLRILYILFIPILFYNCLFFKETEITILGGIDEIGILWNSIYPIYFTNVVFFKEIEITILGGIDEIGLL
jgi:hypothetical protein